MLIGYHFCRNTLIEQINEREAEVELLDLSGAEGDCISLELERTRWAYSNGLIPTDNMSCIHPFFICIHQFLAGHWIRNLQTKFHEGHLAHAHPIRAAHVNCMVAALAIASWSTTQFSSGFDLWVIVIETIEN
jgi:hypothetical protein